MCYYSSWRPKFVGFPSTFHDLNQLNLVVGISQNNLWKRVWRVSYIISVMTKIDYDKLMTAEQELVLIPFLFDHLLKWFFLIRAVADTHGIHSGKEIPPSKQPLNISEVSALSQRMSTQLTSPTDKYACRSIFKQFQTVGKNTCSCGLHSCWITIQVVISNIFIFTFN